MLRRKRNHSVSSNVVELPRWGRNEIILPSMHSDGFVDDLGRTDWYNGPQRPAHTIELVSSAVTAQMAEVIYLVPVDSLSAEE